MIEHPTSPLALRQAAVLALRSKDYQAAKDLLLKLREIEPNDAEVEGVHFMLARVHQELGEKDEAISSLRKLIEVCPNPLPAIEELVAVEQADNNWAKVDELASRYLAVQPMRTMPHEWVVASAKQRSTLQDAADSLNALLHLDPIDPAEIHFTSRRH